MALLGWMWLVSMAGAGSGEPVGVLVDGVASEEKRTVGLVS